MWTLALAGVPLVVLASDVLTRRRLTDALRGWIFRPDETQLFEGRDIIFAWIMLIIGAGLLVWGLYELLVPSKVIVADSAGLRLRLGGPARSAIVVPWDDIDDIGSATVDDEGAMLPVLWIRFFEGHDVPDNPWGARWIDDQTLAILGADWDRSPVAVAEEITAVALAAAVASAESVEESGA